MARTTARGLLTCGAIAGPLFVLVFLVLGASRAGYDPLRHPVSSLEIGALGWTQRLNFLITGFLVVASSMGCGSAGVTGVGDLGRRPGPPPSPELLVAPGGRGEVTSW